MQALAVHAVSAVLPVYNESGVIDDVVRRTAAGLARNTSTWELICVDDGSTDGSGEQIEKLQLPGVRVIRFPRNRGYGHALRAGFQAATLPLVFFMDSDGQFDPEEIASLLALADGADLVVGYRRERADNLLRVILSQGYNWLVRRALPVRVRDVNCAFKLIRRAALARIDPRSGGYAIHAEILAGGLVVREVGVHHRPRTSGTSKIGAGDIPRAVLQLLALLSPARAAARRARSGSLAP
jgi:glycosyltransferase involved in cell wall biosynthesis